MPIRHPFLFNFAASYSGGGYKRLHAYAQWFNANGGAWFAVHPRCAGLITEFTNNQYFVVSRSHLGRLFDDWGYLDDIGTKIGRPELYYVYGIPLYYRFGLVNWSHLSNVLTLGPGHSSVELQPPETPLSRHENQTGVRQRRRYFG